MPHIHQARCDFCGSEDGFNEFWADISFRSKQYLYDDGTCSQDKDWTLCRECKRKFLTYMGKKKSK